MKFFIIQPNLTSNSETWLSRINIMLENNICGFAAFMEKPGFFKQLEVFNLNGRQPDFIERSFIRMRLNKYNLQQTMRRELFRKIRKSGAEALLIQYATTAQYLWDVVGHFSMPVFIYVHGYDIIWDHNNDVGQRIHGSDYPHQILKIAQQPNVSFIVNSDCSCQSLLDIGIDPSKIIKKNFGVTIPVINRTFNNASLNVLFLGRFVDYKGPDIVLKAFIKACSLGFSGNLVMAGDGSLKKECEEIAKDSGYADRISFTGVVNAEEALELFKAADIYSMHNCKGLVSKGYDTFGVTIIEALSFGLPVITSMVGGAAEIIENGVDGILVQPGNVDEHASAFMKLYQNRSYCYLLSNNGKKKVEAKYSSQLEKEALFRILNINQS